MNPRQKAVPFNMELLVVQSERESSYISSVRRRKNQMRMPYLNKRETFNKIRIDLRRERKTKTETKRRKRRKRVRE